MFQVKLSCKVLNKDYLESRAVVFCLLCITNNVSLGSGRNLKRFSSAVRARETV